MHEVFLVFYLLKKTKSLAVDGGLFNPFKKFKKIKILIYHSCKKNIDVDRELFWFI
jgi:hypothetical protein